MPELKEKDKSIIQIIQEMVSNGESEEKIISSLQDLGVEPAKAKRLLLVGQADTFALLRSEINKIVKAELEAQKPGLEKQINKDIQKASEQAKLKIAGEVIKDLEKYEKDITGQSNTFQEQISETVSKVTELSTRVRNQLNALGAQVDTVEKDLDEMKLKGIGARNRIVSMVFIVLGVLFCILAGYFAVSNFIAMETGITVDAIIIMLVTGMIGITMLFVASLL